MQTSFIHLRVSSEFSISRGLLRINEIIENAQKLNMPAVALTDLNNMFGMVKFFKKAEAAGIKPIAGTTLNLKSHAGEFGEILCLAKNNEGLKSLMGIISKSQLQQENGYISITFEDLSSCAGNIIVIAGGSSSTIFNLAKLKKNQDLKTELLSFKETFQDDFCIELQRVGKSFEEEFIQCILPLASEFLIPVIVSNDTMFSQKEDFDIHETKVCINTGKTLNDANRERLFSPEQFFKSSKDISNLFSDCDPETLINNTVAIAQKCNVTLTTDQYFLPEYPVPEEHDFNSFLSELSKKQLDKIIESYSPEEREIYLKRLDYELTQIHATGFSSYFLIVADFIQWSKDNDVPVGPGRGSGAGSLVAYALGITALDPIEHNLLFERFINPERISMPDFDIDFCMDKRDMVIDYVGQKYGKSAVSQIATFGTMAARAVVRDVARALGKPYALGDRISKMIPFIPGMTLEKAISSQPIFKKMIQDEEEVSEIIDLAYKLEGIARNVGKHAGGIVIAPGSIADFCPTYFDPQSDSLMTQFDKDDVETIGLVKFDFLGLRTLTVIDRAVKTINQSLSEKRDRHNMYVELSEPPYGGTIFVTGNVITSTDKSVYDSLVYKGTDRRTMYDFRNGGAFIEHDPFLYDAYFSDGLVTEIQINSEFSVDQSLLEAEKYGFSLGQLSKGLRKHVETMWIHKGTESYGGGNNNILVHTGMSKIYESYYTGNIIEETLLHEATHTSVDAYVYPDRLTNGEEWIKAVDKDNCYISDYARDYPYREDLAELMPLYIAVKFFPARIPEDVRNKILSCSINRILYLDSLSLDLDIYKD